MAVVPGAAPTPVIPPEFQRQMDMLKAQVKYPLADQEIMALIQGDAAAIESAAKKLHEQALAMQTPPTPQPPAPPAPAAVQPPAPAPAQPQPTPQPAPGPAPVPAPTQATPPDAVQEARYNELKAKVEYGIAEPHERLEFFTSAYRNTWNEHVGKMAERRR